MHVREDQLKAFKAFLVDHPEHTREDMRRLVTPWFIEWWLGKNVQHT